MTKQTEAMELALEALESVTVECNNFHHPKKDQNHHWAKCPPIVRWDKAITAIKEALAQHDSVQAKPEPEQEPVAWQTMEAKYPTLEKLDIRMGDGSILCNLWPQSDGDLWWEGSGTGEKFIDPKYANVTHWRVHSDITPPQRTWVGLTVEDVHDCLKGLPTQSIEVYARSVEAKLKQKNGYAEEKNT